MLSVLKKAGLVVVLAAAAASTATPASAASSRCVVGSSGNCTTAAIPAEQFIDYFVDNRLRPTACSYQLREVSSGVLVGRGTADPGVAARGRVTGLSGRYQLELRRCSAGAVGVIDNE
ncbi:hypothetical protein [Lentzea terrae]|jgi:hypothetical protein|uniref:hypothetical protein n=1 Tax=Lentzea terrae TaxID=2200761 RepID=UPI000DD43EB7|nr:hypothetical protein [Lentzea terrae]